MARACPPPLGMRLVNLTAEAFVLAASCGLVEVPPSGVVASAEMILRERPTGHLEGLPVPIPGTVYVVSAAVAKAALAARRLDAFALGPVRDGAITGLVEPW